VLNSLREKLFDILLRGEHFVPPLLGVPARRTPGMALHTFIELNVVPFVPETTSFIPIMYLKVADVKLDASHI
jgi:hypothetical protein